MKKRIWFASFVAVCKLEHVYHQRYKLFSEQNKMKTCSSIHHNSTTELCHFWCWNSKAKLSLVYCEKGNHLQFSDGTSYKLSVIPAARDSMTGKSLLLSVRKKHPEKPFLWVALAKFSNFSIRQNLAGFNFPVQTTQNNPPWFEFNTMLYCPGCTVVYNASPGQAHFVVCTLPILTLETESWLKAAISTG